MSVSRYRHLIDTEGQLADARRESAALREQLKREQAERRRAEHDLEEAAKTIVETRRLHALSMERVKGQRDTAYQRRAAIESRCHDLANECTALRLRLGLAEREAP